MSVINSNGHRLGKGTVPTNDQLFELHSADGKFLHQSISHGILTDNRGYAWRGTQNQLHKTLKALPSKVAAQLKPLAVDNPNMTGKV